MRSCVWLSYAGKSDWSIASFSGTMTPEGPKRRFLAPLVANLTSSEKLGSRMTMGNAQRSSETWRSRFLRK